MILYTDGGCNKNGTYGSFRIEKDNGEIWELIRIPDFEQYGIPVLTNNEAEYATLADALFYCYLQGHSDEPFKVYTDSLLVVNQLSGKWQIKEERLQKFAERVRQRLKNFDIYEIEHVPREIIVGKLGH
jgi:ribonuclease HI